MKTALIICTFILTTLSTYCKIDTIFAGNVVQLEETENAIIYGIEDFTVSPNKAECMIINKTGLSILKYHIKTGKLIKEFKSTPSLNKYLIKKPEYWYDKTFNNYLVIRNKIAQEQVGLDTTGIQNNFITLFYIDDSTIAAGITFRAFAVDTINTKSVLMNLGGVIVFDNNLNILYATPLEATEREFPLYVYSYNSNKKYIIASSSNYITKNKDSMSIFSEYYINGKHKKLLSNLPLDYVESRLNYSLFNPKPSLINFNDKIYWTCPYDYKIRCINKKFSFKIQGFNTSNYDVWKLLLKQNKKINIINKNSRKKKIGMNIKIGKLYKWNDTTIVVTIMNKAHKYYLQFYSCTGKFLRHFVIQGPKNHEIVSITYLPKKHYIYAITLDKNNYYIVKYEIP